MTDLTKKEVDPLDPHNLYPFLFKLNLLTDAKDPSYLQYVQTFCMGEKIKTLCAEVD